MKTRRMTCVLLVFVVFCGPAAAQEPAVYGPFRRAVVAADHPLASQAGLEMLQAGGNVVDAAVAVSFTLSVVRPASCGIGGGGFMLIWDAEKKEAVALDYRERAPLAGGKQTYAAVRPPNTESASMRGGRAVAVPGTVAGLCYAAKKYGKLPLSKLLEPAIRHARDGFTLDATDHRNQQSVLRKFERFPDYRAKYRLLLDGYLNGGDKFAKNDRFRSPQLAALEQIALHGRAGFYSGAVADAIVEAVGETGLVTHRDLKETRPVQRAPLRGVFDDHEILTMPPPSSGGVALLQMLNIIRMWEQRHPDQTLQRMELNSPRYIQLVTESMKHAFADRAEFLGDADFADVPIDRLLSETYAEEIAKRIRTDRTRKPEDYGRFFSQDDSGTSHFSVIDQQGNAVACTETINLVYGSFVVVPKFGFILNDEMDDFAARPGEPNAFGLIQSDANAVAPRKKPLSSMTPTLVIRDGRAVAAMGGSGGPKIISATLQTLLNQIRFGLKPHQAVSRPRFHHQWSPNRLQLERRMNNRVVEAMKKIGHQTSSAGGLGVAQSVGRRADGLYGGSDPRKLGRPAGF